jgi:DHA1 family multidrug resistance protein-like MFS transporter
MYGTDETRVHHTTGTNTTDHDTSDSSMKSGGANSDLEKNPRENGQGQGIFEKNEGNADDEFVVTFGPDDPDQPLNWPFKKKAIHTMFFGLTTFAAQYNSASMSSVTSHISNAFDVNQTVGTLPTSLFVLGVAFGPMLFAPISEVYGRKIGVLGPFFLSLIFTLGTGGSTNLASVLCTRFFAGLFASAPIVSSGGVLADIWPPAYRGTSLVFYAYFVVNGTTLAPLFSSLVVQSDDSEWKWASWLTCIICGVILIADLLLLHETYPPVLLSRRARKLRFQTKNWAYHAKHDEWQLTANEFLTVHFVRPFAMLATPIVFCIAMYASYVYGVLYLVITSVSETFREVHGWSATSSNLPMIGVTIGAIIGGLFNIYGGLRYARLSRELGGKPLPEERMLVMMYCGWMMPAGIFIFAWTQDKDIHWIAPIIGLGIMFCGFFTIFQGCLNYLVDAFTKYSASAIAANTFTRSVFGAVFPLFGHSLFRNLGVHWGGSTLGFIALGMIPIPFIFYIFGKPIRAKNPYINLVT